MQKSEGTWLKTHGELGVGVGQELRAQSQGFLHILCLPFWYQVDEYTDIYVCKYSEKFHENRYQVTTSKERIGKQHIILRLMALLRVLIQIQLRIKLHLKCSVSLEHECVFLQPSHSNKPGYFVGCCPATQDINNKVPGFFSVGAGTFRGAQFFCQEPLLSYAFLEIAIVFYKEHFLSFKTDYQHMGLK